MGPLSVTAGAIAVDSLATQSVRAVYKSIDDFKEAPQAIAHSKALLSGTQSSLESLTECLKREQTTEAQLGGVLHRVALDKTLLATNELCKRFDATITKFTSRSTDSRLRNRDQLLFTFNEPRIAKFNKELGECQRTIQLMTGTITLVVAKGTMKDIQDLSTRFQAQEQALSLLSTELSNQPIASDELLRISEEDMTPEPASNNQNDLERTEILQKAVQAAMVVLNEERGGQTFGDMKTDQSSVAMQGEAGMTQGGGTQSFGRFDTTNKSKAFQGRLDGPSFAHLFK